MIDLISKIENLASKNKLLEAQLHALKFWTDQKFKHNKHDLEKMLQYSIAKIQFLDSVGNKTTVVCTSNMLFINLLKAKTEQDVKTALKTAFDSGIHVPDSNSVMTYDLVGRSLYTILLKSWEIVNCIEIMPSNALVLAGLVNEVLSARKIQNAHIK